MDKEIKSIICQLRTYELSVRDVPEEVALNSEIIRAERKYGLRKSHNRGFDVINQVFFVEEELFYKDLIGKMTSRMIKTTFRNLEEFYNFLEGDIYADACYKYYNFDKDKIFVMKNKINIERLKERVAFITQTIDSFTFEVSQEELNEYEEGEKTKELCKKWIKKFDNCKCYEVLSKTVINYEKSKIGKSVDVSFFFYNYIYKDITDKERFATVMEYMCTGKYPEYKLINSLCSIYTPEEVVENYNYSAGVKQTNYKHKKKLKHYVSKLKSGGITFDTRSFFDSQTHFYCEEIVGFEGDEKRWPSVRFQRYFETFAEFMEYRKGDLKGCDLSKAIKLDVDFSKYIIDEKTKLPLGCEDVLECTVKKEYRESKFYVEQQWRNASGCLIKKNVFSTLYFFDFIFYLKNDLSNAYLLFCDGLSNLTSAEGIIFDGALMTSIMCEQFGVDYETYKLNKETLRTFEITEKNEKATALALKTNEENSRVTSNNGMHSLSIMGDCDKNSQRVYYITDLHLMHRLENAKCKSKADVLYVVQSIVENIARESKELLLIGGDISSDYKIFKLFVEVLKSRLNQKKYGKTDVIFILGNHELWEFPEKSIDEIAEIYRKIIEQNGMFFIQNDLLYKDLSDKFCKISGKQLYEYDGNQLREQLQSTRLVIFGGLGFSGYNEEFNANIGMYRDTLDRKGEIVETEKFEELYNKVMPNISDKNVIILTHTPKKDWCKTAEPQHKFIYVSGHTHRNDFYDDGDYRIYSDNQIGYYNENPHLKNFLMDNEYDYFSDYEDGIHEISGSQYNDFYRGKNVQMNFTREVNVLYMLKKKGYYCFIHKAKSGSLTILNGGALKKLDVKDVQYYYNHMDEVVLYIRNPFDNYMRLQQRVSEEIQKLGGVGGIHGCIIDVDWHNHIYVNPVDMNITGYWALDMINKLVYPDVPSLLKAECPALYKNYLKLIKGDTKNPLVPSGRKKGEVTLLPQEYLSTDIYRASREIKKMQKLTSNILSSWYENPMETNALAENVE